VNARIAGLASYVPETKITNADLEKIVETNDEWIVSRSGIHERRKTAPDEFVSHLVIKAAERLFADTGADPTDIQYVIAATITGDYGFPSVATLVQNRFKFQNAGAIDLGAGCAGFVYGLDVADALIAAGRAKKVLLVAGETLTKITNYEDRTTCVLFGDGAGAVLLEAVDAPSMIRARRVGSDGSGGHFLYQTGLRHEIGGKIVEHAFLHQDGRDVYRWAVERVSNGVAELLGKAGLTTDEIDWFVPHSANLRIVESVCKRTGIPLERTLTSLEYYGNTSSATIPLALDPAIADGRVKRGQNVLVYGFGAGLVDAAMILRF